MTEVEKILYAMGYYDGDPYKKAQVEGYIAEAVEFMKAAGVPAEKITSQSAYAIKDLWANSRDKGEAMNLVQENGLIVHLIAQMRPVKKRQ